VAPLAEGDRMLGRRSNESQAILALWDHVRPPGSARKNTYGETKGQDVKRLKEREQAKPQAQGLICRCPATGHRPLAVVGRGGASQAPQRSAG